MAVYVFDPEQFKTVRPQFAGLDDAVLIYYFNAACSIIDNKDGSLLPYDPDHGVFLRQMILDALTCHLLTVDVLISKQTGGVGGQVTSASEGSVSVSFNVPPVTQSSYYLSTPCGQAFLSFIRPYIQGGRLASPKGCHPWG
jgi:hypothetical protein